MPYEYVLYDAVTGEHLGRPNMIRSRRLTAEQRIAGSDQSLDELISRIETIGKESK
jgi:hypothetical protein